MSNPHFKTCIVAKFEIRILMFELLIKVEMQRYVVTLKVIALLLIDRYPRDINACA